MAGRLPKGKLPKLSARGKKGYYGFRNFLDSQQGARHQAKTQRSAHRLAEKVVQDITGSSVERLAVADVFTKWSGMTPEFADLAARCLKPRLMAIPSGNNTCESTLRVFQVFQPEASRRFKSAQ